MACTRALFIMMRLVIEAGWTWEGKVIYSLPSTWSRLKWRGRKAVLEYWLSNFISGEEKHRWIMFCPFVTKQFCAHIMKQRFERPSCRRFLRNSRKALRQENAHVWWISNPIPSCWWKDRGHDFGLEQRIHACNELCCIHIARRR